MMKWMPIAALQCTGILVIKSDDFDTISKQIRNTSMSNIYNQMVMMKKMMMMKMMMMRKMRKEGCIAWWVSSL